MSKEYYSHDHIYHPLIFEGGYVLDPFWKEEYWVYNSQIPSYFKNNYGLELYQVWNLVNGFHEDQKHYCPICGKELSFRKLSKGFGNTCSRSCAQSYSLYNLWKDEDYKKHMSWVTSERNKSYSNPRNQEEFYRYYQFLISRTYRAELFRTKRSNSEFRYFYIARFNEGFKIGLYSDNNWSGESYLTSYLQEGYSKLELYILDAYKACDLEYFIKKSLVDHLYDFYNKNERGRTELFYSNEYSEEVLKKYIDEYSPKLVKIYE